MKGICVGAPPPRTRPTTTASDVASKHMRVMSPCNRPVSHLAPCFYADATCHSVSPLPGFAAAAAPPSLLWSSSSPCACRANGATPPRSYWARLARIRLNLISPTSWRCACLMSASPCNAVQLLRPPPRSHAQMATRQMAARQMATWQMTARQPDVTSAVSDADDALLEQLATDELGRRKLNPRRPNSGMMRGF